MAENQNTNSNVLIDQLTEKLESVTRLDPEPLSFSDLPSEILGGIVQKLDLVSRMITRKVSRRLRDVVDKQKAEYDIISIHTEKNRVDIVFDEVMVHYRKIGCLIHNEDDGDSFKHKFIKDDNFLEIALNDLTIALKKPKFQLKCFGLVFHSDGEAETAKILELIESLKSPIHTMTFLCTTGGIYDILPILSLLEPGTLERLGIVCVDTSLNLNEIVEMDQWKLAKRVRIDDILARPIPFGIDHFLHFDRFFIIVDVISPQDVLRFLDAFSKSTSFENCSLQFSENSVNLAEIGRTLGATVVQTSSGPTIVHRHPIPGSKEFLEFKVVKNNLSIEKKL